MRGAKRSSDVSPEEEEKEKEQRVVSYLLDDETLHSW